MKVLIPFLLLAAMFACSCSGDPDAAGISKEIGAVLDKQVEDWNAANLDGYMEAYEKTDSVRFASGGNITHGWKTVAGRMKDAYPNAETMGTLRFVGVDIDVLSDDAALVFGKWVLTRTDDTPWGLFTLLMKRTDSGWKIVADHTSLAKK